MLVLVAGLVVAADQATKWLAVDRLGPNAADHRVEILGRVLAFEYLENTGAAFGVLDGQGSLLTVLAVIVVAVIVGGFLRSRRPPGVLAVSLGFLVGGAIGNVADRVRLGYVVDFVAVGVWPKFNVADSAVTIGVILLAWAFMRDTEEPHTDRSAATPVGDRVPGERTRLGMSTMRQREGG